jgi:hypothetical protein
MKDLRENIKADFAAQPTAVGPTLVVGLGGTGKEVLFRLRRLIVERFGSLDELPCIQFLLLDTDQTNEAKRQSDIPIADDRLYDKVKFRPSETINLSIPGGTGALVSNIERFPHIREWFQDKGKIASMGDLADGAAQVRMASRLAFYSSENYEAISAKLDAIPGRLGNPTVGERVATYFSTYDIKECNVHVVTSLAGGTGSGIFLDMGFLLKAKMQDYKRTAYLFFPSLYANLLGERRMRANGYAALKELNQYSFGTKFKANWTGQEARLLPPPPYTYTYFLDHLNEAGMYVGKERNSVYQMVAESIFQEFSFGDFAGAKRSVRSNMANFLNNAKIDAFWEINPLSINRQEGVTGDSFVTRFSSFGQASISFPTDRVHNACACKLGQDVLNFWQHNVADDPREVLFTKFLKKPTVNFIQGEYTPNDGSPAIDRNDVIDELLWSNKEAQETLLHVIRSKVVEVRQNLEKQPNGSKAAALQKARDGFDQWLAREDSEDPDDWGQCIRTVDLNARNYLKSLLDGIRLESDAVSNNPRQGVVYALALLQELKRLLSNENFRYRPWFETELSAWSETAQYQLEALEQVQLELSNHESSFLFRGANVTRDIDLLVAPEQDAEDQGILYYYLKARVMRQVLKRCKKICDEVDKFLGADSPSGNGLLGKYHHLLSSFDDLKEGLKSLQDYFETQRDSMFVTSLYRNGDTDRWYKNWMTPDGDASKFKDTLRSLGDRLLSDIFGVESVTAALNKFRSEDPDAINKQILRHFKAHFAGKPKQPSALQLFFEGGRTTEQQQQEAINRAMNNARVWARSPGRADIPINTPPPDQFLHYVGVDTSDPLLLGRFSTLIRNTAASEKWQIRATGQDHQDAIHFYSELAGIPACYPSSVSAQDGLRDCYNQYFRNPAELDPNNQEVLHTDKNRFKFQDIVPKSKTQAITFKMAVRSFVLGRMLGLVGFRPARRNEPASRDAFTYIDDTERFSAHRTVVLGETEQDAIDFLYQRDDVVLPRLHEKIQSRLDFLKEDMRRLAKFTLLAEFYRTNLYPPEEDAESFKDIPFRRLLPQYEVLRMETARHAADLSAQAANQLDTFRNELLGGRTMAQAAREILASFTKPSGYYQVQALGEVQQTVVNRLDTLVLDWDKIEPPSPGPQIAAPTQSGVCPLCGKGINERAIFCAHCKKPIGKHITCDNCGETQVPDYAEKCWKCGFPMAPKQEIIECPRCFAYKNTLDKFPCQVCGYDPKNPDGSVHAGPAAEKPADSASAAAPEAEPRPEPGNGDAGFAKPEAEATDPGGQGQAQSDMVECPSCYGLVPKGIELCPHCNALLTAS